MANRTWNQWRNSGSFNSFQRIGGSFNAINAYGSANISGRYVAPDDGAAVPGNRASVRNGRVTGVNDGAKPVLGPTIQESSRLKKYLAEREKERNAWNQAVANQNALINSMLQQQRNAAQAQRRADRQGRRSAYASYASVFENYGLNGREIMKAMKKLPKNAWKSPNGLPMVEAIRSTKTWGERFGGVTKMRKKQGLAYIDEGEIVRREATFQEALNPLGIGKKRMDKYIDFWIGKGVSLAEVSDRVTLANQWVHQQDNRTLQYMRERYGVQKKHLAAYVLDGAGRKGKQPVEWLQEQLQEAKLGGTAKAYGMDISTGFAKRLAKRDVATATAGQAFAYATENEAQLNFYAGLSGDTGFTRTDLAKGVLNEAGYGFEEGTNIRKKSKRLASEERARWASTAGGAGAGAFGGSEGSY